MGDVPGQLAPNSRHDLRHVRAKLGDRFATRFVTGLRHGPPQPTAPDGPPSSHECPHVQSAIQDALAEEVERNLRDLAQIYELGIALREARILGPVKTSDDSASSRAREVPPG